MTVLDSYIRLILACTAIVWLAGCASAPSQQAIVVDDASLGTRHPYSVSVSTTGGGETTATGYSNISNEDLAAAIEDSITKSRLFAQVIKGDGADYKLSVSLISMSKPMFGFAFTIDMEMAWSLVNARTGAIVMRESIKSSYTAEATDAFAAVTRIRLAVEGAARNNIREGLQKMAALPLD